MTLSGKARARHVSPPMIDRITRAEIRALQHLPGRLAPGALGHAADLLLGADAVYVFGQDQAFPVAAYLGHALARAGLRTRLIAGVGGSAEQELGNVSPDDVLLAASVAPDAAEAVTLLRRIAGRAPIIALADSRTSPLLELAQVVLAAEPPATAAAPVLPTALWLAWSLVVHLSREHAA